MQTTQDEAKAFEFFVCLFLKPISRKSLKQEPGSYDPLSKPSPCLSFHEAWLGHTYVPIS